MDQTNSDVVTTDTIRYVQRQANHLKVGPELYRNRRDSIKTLMVNLARPLPQTHHAEIFEVPLRSVHQDYEMNEPREIGLLFLV